MIEVSRRSFEFANKREDGFVVVENGHHVKAFSDAQLPEYQTKHAAGADFFCAEDVIVPSIWKQVFRKLTANLFSDSVPDIEPTFVHTGVKANMESDEYLELVGQISDLKNRGLLLADGGNVIDSDYYENRDNDGEITFAFYNIRFTDVVIRVGDRIGQGIFHKYLRPYDETKGLRIKGNIITGDTINTKAKK